MLVPRIIKLIQNMETCQEEWKDVSECKKSQALVMTEETLSNAFAFTFNRLSKDIDPKEAISSHLSTFKLHNMHKMMVSEETNNLRFHRNWTHIFFQSLCIVPMIMSRKGKCGISNFLIP